MGKRLRWVSGQEAGTPTEQAEFMGYWRVGKTVS